MAENGFRGGEGSGPVLCAVGTHDLKTVGGSQSSAIRENNNQNSLSGIGFLYGRSLKSETRVDRTGGYQLSDDIRYFITNLVQVIVENKS